VHLAKWTAEYYAAGAGETITAALPPKVRRGELSGHRTQRIAMITPTGKEALADHRRTEDVAGRDGDARSPAARLTPRRRQVLEWLDTAPDGLSGAELLSRGTSAGVLAGLLKKGLIGMRGRRVDRDPFARALDAPPVDPDRRLTPEQAAALDLLERRVAARAFHVVLLHGVTGSGKTEIYLRLSAQVRAESRSVLMLVPEIALTPVTASLFQRAFGRQVAILHSGLSDGERHDEWQRVRRREVQVVVGTRSAVFAPLADIGLIVVDEEHDASYKQQETPRYNGRDVAIVRGREERALVVLASATPSMESYHNAATGRYERVSLAHRVGGRPLPSVTIVDMRSEYAASGPDVVLSQVLRDAVGARLARREQALVLLNRRGFATSVFCRQCAATLECPNCSISLVVHGHGSARRAQCHYCNHSIRVPPACPLCAGPYLEQAGFGTERVEAEIVRAWPLARVARLDRDAIRRRGALTTLLRRFQQGEIDVLVGTQMVAKGHDFPRVTLVGVVSADVGLGVADFRASERTFQLLTQVAGRAGRGGEPGEAVVQTLYPRHYSIELACRQDVAAFYERELKFRRAMRYPPVVPLVNVIVRSRTLSGALEDAGDVAAQVRHRAGDEVRVLGPAPAPLSRLRGEYRAQLLLKGSNRTKIREALRRAVAGRPGLARRTMVDVDPLSVL
jgi:primosomal protein N' (replication factor Y)